MRVSVEDKPGWECSRRLRKPIRVCVDGVQVHGVVEADEEKGTVLAYSGDPFKARHVLMAVYLGKVEIRQGDA